MNFASIWYKLFKHCISVEILLLEGYVQIALPKEQCATPFLEHFKAATLERSC